MKKLAVLLIVLVLAACGCIGATNSSSPTHSTLSEAASSEAGFAIIVTGLMDGKVTLDELQSLGGIGFNATLVKSTGKRINNTYVGVPLVKVFQKLGVNEGEVKWVRFVAEDGYTITLSIDDLKNAYLCWEENGRPLGQDDGGPVKLVIRDQPGKLWVKWLKEMELIGDENAVVIDGKVKLTVVVTADDMNELMKEFGENVTVTLKGKNVTFSGVPLGVLIDKARSEADTNNVTFIAGDGYTATVNFESAYEKALLVFENGDEPSFRVVIPGEPSRTWVKELVEIRVG